MKPHHLLTGLFVLAAALSAAALWQVNERIGATWHDGHPVVIVTFGVAFAEISLASVWLAWGRWNLAVRAGLLLLAIAGWYYPLARCVGATRSPWWGGLLLLFASFVVAMLLVMRWAGFRIACEGQPPPALSNRKWWQFTIGGILTFTTLAAMVLGLGRHFAFPWEEIVPACLFCSVSAAGSAAAVFATLRAPNTMWATVAPPLIGAVVGYLLRFTRLAPEPYWALVWMSVVQGAVIALAGNVLRVAGFRLTRGEEQTPSAAERQPKLVVFPPDAEAE